MPDTATNPPYFAQAVSRLGNQRAMRTTQPVYGAQGIKVLDKGAKLNARLYERLVQHHPSTALEDAIEIESAVSGKNLRALAEALLDGSPVFMRMAEKPADRRLLLDCLEAVPLPPAVVFQLTVVHDVQPELFRYLVASALTAVWLGNGPLAVRHDLVMLAAAGLLHNLGMMHIDPVLLQPGAQISREQRRQLYSHPLVSVLLLERHHEYTADMLRAIREHHEVLDGSGYPGGLSSSAISPWGRILSLAQVVAALVKPGRSHALLRVSVLLRTNRHRFDPALVDRLLPLLLQPAGDSAQQNGIDNPVSDPVGQLNRIHQALLAWPASLAKDAQWPAARRSGMLSIGERCARVLRTLVESGVSSEQLHSLDQDAITGALADELSLVTHELAWQLRALEREARRRWRLAAGEQMPAALAQWIETVEQICASLTSPEANHGPGA
nr:HD domain-containing phosphohydrolase [uncultured Albidiferax sp.]